jgi:hypothetical protein
MHALSDEGVVSEWETFCQEQPVEAESISMPSKVSSHGDCPVLLLNAQSFVQDAPEDTAGDPLVALDLVWSRLSSSGSEVTGRLVSSDLSLAPTLGSDASMRFCAQAEALFAEGRAWHSTRNNLDVDLAEARRMVPDSFWVPLPYPTRLGMFPTQALWRGLVDRADSSAFPAVRECVCCVRDCNRDPLWKARIMQILMQLAISEAEARVARDDQEEHRSRAFRSAISVLASEARRREAQGGLDDLCVEIADLEEGIRGLREDDALGEDDELSLSIGASVTEDAAASVRRKLRRRKKQLSSLRSEVASAKHRLEGSHREMHLALHHAVECIESVSDLLPHGDGDADVLSNVERAVRDWELLRLPEPSQCHGGGLWLFQDWSGRASVQAASGRLHRMMDSELDDCAALLEHSLTHCKFPSEAVTADEPNALRPLLAMALHRHTQFHPQPGVDTSVAGTPSVADCAILDTEMEQSTQSVTASLVRVLGHDARTELARLEREWFEQFGRLPPLEAPSRRTLSWGLAAPSPEPSDAGEPREPAVSRHDGRATPVESKPKTGLAAKLQAVRRGTSAASHGIE